MAPWLANSRKASCTAWVSVAEVAFSTVTSDARLRLPTTVSPRSTRIWMPYSGCGRLWMFGLSNCSWKMACFWVSSSRLIPDFPRTFLRCAA